MQLCGKSLLFVLKIAVFPRVRKRKRKNNTDIQMFTAVT